MSLEACRSRTQQTVQGLRALGAWGLGQCPRVRNCYIETCEDFAVDARTGLDLLFGILHDGPAGLVPQP